ncbi:bifunctional N(6)-L-threonylcarbamoyladenine synthase/serine/threonine protein kinase [Methanococcus aeolicus]|uniref:Probable bifunctional tRNA threonylcarbamoyladenosine biosynthesis protein n=1 Tax=Methanococcus aeolicus (strain ATCC BAA-1280 / DSM 17508 / OCM 812 / Nankai-3) TaxID=419665 RepID=A6UWA3_META3|nr:bifunctional N(6)-L-threonylcarbamoyladenine synthase/serine/threonine protein kinase [Methanococcus aeolicus]ABR56775.1 putative metalloendopeptidase, glycoprotease family [Methanococcus aeolicus Nankai-3]UXM84788.1 bifunctional N(6)-L-threonylcarbamoyladenine synthase/serine/threonine protein kinase [Methanococcus aeolicus]
MICIGLEGTAEKTGVGVVDSGGTVLFNKTIIYKPPVQGINPREAADHHAETFPKLIEEALKVIPKEKIDLIAFSQGPGLGPSLRVSATAGRALALSLKKPIIGVNHCVGHVEIGKLTTGAKDPLTLYVSGGNTQVLGYAGGRYRVFGETLDIAIGNCLDQFARNCGLPHPGGVFVEQKAKESSKKLIKLPYSVKGMDITFSGLLTSSIKAIKDKHEKIEDVCYSLQETAFSMITEITERALAHTNKPEVMLVGGVAANNRLREMLSIMCGEQNVEFHVPEPQFCGDNGAMIAWLGLLQYINGKRMDIMDTKINPVYRSDMVEVNWINGKNNYELKREIPTHLIGKGAEADIKKIKYLDWDSITKERVVKNYRVKELDKLIRTERTIKESRFLNIIKDFFISAPFVYDIDKKNTTITMSYISGKMAKEIIDGGDLSCCNKIGKIIGELHKNNIIHNDLTTSNFMVEKEKKGNNKVYIIDFGLGTYSNLIENKAVDLIVLKKSILSTHFDKFEEIWDKIIDGYKIYPEWEKVLKHMEDVEKRARYV